MQQRKMLRLQACNEHSVKTAEVATRLRRRRSYLQSMQPCNPCCCCRC